MKKYIASLFAAAFLVASFPTEADAWRRWSRKKRGAVAGAASGAVIGGVAKGGKGAVVGTAVGAGTGYLFGKRRDRKKGPR